MKWARRLLWLLLFVSFMVVMGHWDKPYTYTFLGAVLCLLLPLLFTKDEDWLLDEKVDQQAEVVLSNEQ